MPRSSKTIESYCRQVMAFFRWCKEEEILERDPTERLKLPKAEKKQIRVFADEEIKKLHEVCIPSNNGLRPDVYRMLIARNRAILWVLLDTGMRARPGFAACALWTWTANAELSISWAREQKSGKSF